MTKSFRMLNNGADTLEETLEFGKRAGEMSRVGFVAKEEFTSWIRRSKPEACVTNQMSTPILVGYPNQTHQAKPKHETLNRKQQWVAKNVALVAHTSLRMPAKKDWYLDNGCSNHMTGRKNLLVDIKLDGTSYVTLGDGEIREVKGIGKSGYPGVPNLNNVLLVQGLAANLISISQLCDEGFNVRFTKE
ncbi:uncharacterized protein LOC131627862 [Vicia villosa]|uniref:uncharacterized protein LOC131627862 n=1 Tax=Vicia villosa TaxID=3911 RepID=UPI00273B8597|nr:uncharacterized protein LOC131627862 [Vicia villosa]